MEAVMVFGTGDLRVSQVPDPVLRREDDVIVQVGFGGICGSDLHYVRDGTSGTSILRHPMILGHEVVGRIAEHGPAVRGLRVGDAVAIHPSRACGTCTACLAGRPNLCAVSTYLGSAAHLPHTNGGFSERIRVPERRVRRIPTTIPLRTAVIAEPLAVAIHAVERAGLLRGRSVLVNGVGPIGALAVGVAARTAESVVASDLSARSLAIAAQMGAESTVDIAHGETLPTTDVVIESSGTPAGLNAAIRSVARGGTIVQVGNLPATSIELTLGDLVSKEIELRGSYRFTGELDTALDLLATGLDVSPVLTHDFPFRDAAAAFALAADKNSGSAKVVLRFGDCG